MVKRINSKEMCCQFNFYLSLQKKLKCLNQPWIEARRLVERYNELPDRYMQVIGRCRDPGSLDDLEELRRSRPVRKENKEQVKLERSLMRKEKAAVKEDKMWVFWFGQFLFD